MVPTWLNVVAWISLALAGYSMIIIVLDLLNGQRQPMTIMNIVWPVTALYFGPLAVWAYWRLGRTSSTKETGHTQRPQWQTTLIGVTHCGAGCTLGDIIAEWSVFGLGITIAGIALWPEYLADYFLAYLLGIVFQYFAIAPMRHLTGWQAIWAAIKADTLSLTAFEVGLFLWMALTSRVLFHPALQADQPTYWFMMQIGMILGFATSYPMNWWLITHGIKEAM